VNYPVASLLLAGHGTLDRTNSGYTPGGSVIYGAALGIALEIEITILSSLPPDYPLPEQLEDITLINVPTQKTTVFHNTYSGEKRKMEMISRAKNLSLSKINPKSYDGIFIAPVAGEIAVEETAELADSKNIIGLGLQGWLKDETNFSTFVPTRQPQELNISWANNILGFCSSADYPGNLDSSRLKQQRLFVTEGFRGATLYQPEKETNIPALTTNAKDPTGAGDVFAVGTLIYLLQNSGASLKTAGCFGSAAASMVVETPGVRYDYPAVELQKRFKQLVQK